MNTAALSLCPVIAALALILSVPRFVEGMLLLPGNAAIENLGKQTATSGTLDSVISSRERTVDVLGRGKYRSDLVAALILKSRTLPPDQQKQILNRAVTEAEAAVAAAPADAYTWHRLALASFNRDGVSRKMVNEELSSIAVGPYLEDLMVPRLDLLFAARVYLESQFDDIIDDQIRVAWQRNLSNVVRTIRRRGTADIVRRALEREPAMLTDDDFNLWVQNTEIR
jgi:hypothetical protein